MGSLQPWWEGALQAPALCARPWVLTPGNLTVDVTKHRHTAGCGVVRSSFLPLKFLAREQGSPRLCPGEEWIIKLCCQLPFIVWCTAAVVPSPSPPFENKHINRIDYLIGPWAAGSGLHLELISPLSHTHCLELFTSTNRRLASLP